MTTPHLQRITDIITPTAEGMGFRLVRVKLTDVEGRHTLQILAEPLDQTALTVEQCKELSYALAAVLDVEDPIKAAYSLEVSSPGLNRPLTLLEDFTRFHGKEITLEAFDLIEDRKRFKAVIDGVEDESIRLLQDDRTYLVPFAEIKDARLVPEMKIAQPKKNIAPKRQKTRKQTRK